MRRSRYLAATVIALALGRDLAAQTVYVSNLSSPRASSGISISGTAYQGDPFTTDAASSYVLASVTRAFLNATNTSGNFFGAVYSGATEPTTLVPNGTLVGTANPATAGNYTFTTGATVTLAPATTYWLVWGVSSGSGVYKIVGNTNDIYSVSTWMQNPDEFAHSGNAGSTWSTGPTTTPGAFEVSATPIPEPSLGAVLGGLCVFGFAARRRGRGARRVVEKIRWR